MLNFTHPLFLLGLLGLGAPVFLHLMNRALPLRVDFPSIRFIRYARLPRQGRRRLRDLLLLLLRLLLLAAAVLALARPVWTIHRAPPAAATAAAAIDTVVMVDVSASLSGWSGANGLRERVRTAINTKTNGNDAVGLVIYADRVLQTLPPGTGRAVLEAAVADLNCALTPADPASALRESLLLFRPNRRRRLVIVSDLQQGSWPLSRLPILGRDVDVELAPVNAERRHNSGIAGVRVTPLAGQRLRLLADVRNYGNLPEARALTLQAGEHSETRKLELPALGRRRLAFVVEAPTASSATLRLDPDRYGADDQYRVWIGAVPPVTVLAVAPLTREPAKEEELFFLRKVLEAADPTSPLRFKVEVVDSDFFFALNLDRVQALLLLGAAGYFGEPEFAKVRQLLADGGLVLCTPGNTAAHQFRGLHQHELLPAEFVGIQGDTGQRPGRFAVGWVNPGTSLADLFPASEPVDLFLFPVRQYVHIRTLTDTVQVLLRFEDESGPPAVVRQRVGAGTLIASCLAFDGRASDLPVTNSFVPLVRELLAPAVPPNRGVERLECGEPLPELLTLLGDDADADAAADASATTAVPGVFVRQGIPHQVNVPQVESSLEQVNPYDLHARLTGGDAATAPGAPADTAAARPDLRRIELWPVCALAAAMLILAEMALAAALSRRELGGRHA